jgi:hypothetical protein
VEGDERIAVDDGGLEAHQARGQVNKGNLHLLPPGDEDQLAIVPMEEDVLFRLEGEPMALQKRGGVGEL